MKSKKCFKVNISLIHHVESIRLRCQRVKFVAVMPLAVRDMDIGRYVASQIQQGMHLDCSFAVFPQSPRCKLYTGRYGRGIKCIYLVVNGNLRQLDI